MKKSKSTSFSNARIVRNEDELLIIEAGKKDAPDQVFNLLDEIEAWIGEEGISLTIKKDFVISSDDIIE